MAFTKFDLMMFTKIMDICKFFFHDAFVDHV